MANRVNSKVIVVRIDEELHKRIRAEAITAQVPITEKARQYLTRGMENEKQNS